MDENKLEKEIEEYRKLASADKKIDVASLMISALEKHKGNYTSPTVKRWSYLIALSIPGVGFLLAANFYMSDKDDAMQAAVICAVLSVLSILLTILLSKALFPPQLIV